MAGRQRREVSWISDEALRRLAIARAVGRVQRAVSEERRRRGTIREIPPFTLGGWARKVGRGAGGFLRGVQDAIRNYPQTPSVGLPGMMPIARGERASFPAAGGATGGFRLPQAYPERNAERAKAEGKRFSTRTGNTSGRVGRLPSDVRDDVADAAKAVSGAVKRGAGAVLDLFGKGREGARADVERRFAERRARIAERHAEDEAAERRRVADETAAANLESARLGNESRRLTNEARQTRFDLLKGRAEAENAENARRVSELEAQTAANRMKAEQTRAETEGIRARMRGDLEAKFAKEGLSAQDIRSRMANIRRAYGKDVSDEQWQSATGFDPNADIGEMGRADRQRYAQALDSLQGRVGRYQQGQARQRRIAEARAYQRQIMEQRGHWSNGGYQSANKPIFTPNGMTAAQVDFSNRLKAQRMAREMGSTTREQRALYGQMLRDGTVTSMNIASFQGMGMQGDRLNQAIGATTGGQAYLDMRDAIAFQRDYMMKEAEMRGKRSAAAMGQVAGNAVSGKAADDPGTQAAVDNLAYGTEPPRPVQMRQPATQAPMSQEPRGFRAGEGASVSSGEMADGWKRNHGMTVA